MLPNRYNQSMVRQTHEIAAAVSLIGVAAFSDLPSVDIPTLTAVVIAALVGGAFPDLDHPTASIWQRLPLGTVLGRLLAPFMGGHRHLSHSLLGLALFGFLSWVFLDYLGNYLLVDMPLVWIAFIVGFASHIFTDGLTEEGVPLLFPLPFKFGFPPIEQMRIETGMWFERWVVTPGLVALGLVLVYLHQDHFTIFFQALQA